MSGNAVTEFTSVQSQYEAQVTADLERNETEQVRLRAEIESLQGQLETLERDHALLLGVQRVFADSATPAAAPGAKVPRARRAKRPVKAKVSAGSGAKAPAKKREAPAKKRAKSATKPAAKAPAAAGTAEKQPSLAQLVSTMLAAHGEPRSAAEVSAELAADHPLRNSNVNVVRNALELLVSKSDAHRGKQNNSVFYTHASGADATPSPATPSPAPAAG